MDKLPKYVRNANKIIQILDGQDDKVWDRTQKELSNEVGISLAELSTLLKTMIEAGKIKKGGPLVGHRGRTSKLILVDNTPFETSIRRELNRRTDDRVLLPEEEVNGVIPLKGITVEQIGSAVVRTLKTAWKNEENYIKNRGDQLNKIKEFRDRLNEERELRARLVAEKDRYARRLEEMEAEQTKMRAEINRLLLSTHERKGGGSFKVREILDQDELQLLESLMKSKPGFYKDSDAEVGAAAK